MGGMYIGWCEWGKGERIEGVECPGGRGGNVKKKKKTKKKNNPKKTG